MTDFELAVYTVAFLLSCGYAAVLDRHPNWTPDWTWMEVVVGVTYTLIAATVVVWSQPMDGRAAMARVVGAFVATGLPIIIWQLNLIRRRLQEIIDRRVRRGKAAGTSEALRGLPEAEDDQ